MSARMTDDELMRAAEALHAERQRSVGRLRARVGGGDTGSPDAGHSDRPGILEDERVWRIAARGTCAQYSPTKRPPPDAAAAAAGPGRPHLHT